jgi:hypothetical protein
VLFYSYHAEFGGGVLLWVVATEIPFMTNSLTLLGYPVQLVVDAALGPGPPFAEFAIYLLIGCRAPGRGAHFGAALYMGDIRDGCHDDLPGHPGMAERGG